MFFIMSLIYKIVNHKDARIIKVVKKIHALYDTQDLT